MLLLSSFFSILDLALVLALLSNAIAIALATKASFAYLSVPLYSFGRLFTFRLPFIHLSSITSSFSFMLSPFTLYQPQLHNPTTPPLHLPIHPPTITLRPYDENSAPASRVYPELAVRVFLVFSVWVSVSVGVGVVFRVPGSGFGDSSYAMDDARFCYFILLLFACIPPLPRLVFASFADPLFLAYSILDSPTEQRRERILL